MKYNNLEVISVYKKCPNCGLIYPFETDRCYNDNSLLRIYTDEKFESDKSRNVTQTFANLPKCPTCGSTNIQKISDLRRGVHAVAWGLLSNTARSQFECKNCGYKW